MQFEPSPASTVGVEWELQLLDPESLDLIYGIMPLMEFFPNATYVKPEFIQSCVELTSCISNNSDAAVLHLQGSLQMMLQRCRELEMSVCGAGTHPFCRRLALITPLPRYRDMAKESGYLAHRQITFSTHVHVGMASGDQAILGSVTPDTSIVCIYCAVGQLAVLAGSRNGSCCVPAPYPCCGSQLRTAAALR